MISPSEFVDLFGSQKNRDIVQFAKIDPAYTSGRPRVIYDMDVVSSTLSKPLSYVDSYTPAAGDRIMIIKGVIIGKIT